MSNRCATDYFVFEELEKRILFSADIGVLAPELPGTNVVALDLPQYQSPVLPASQGDRITPDATQENRVRHEVVFIDGAVDGAPRLPPPLSTR